MALKCLLNRDPNPKIQLSVSTESVSLQTALSHLSFEVHLVCLVSFCLNSKSKLSHL